VFNKNNNNEKGDITCQHIDYMAIYDDGDITVKDMDIGSMTASL